MPDAHYDYDIAKIHVIVALRQRPMIPDRITFQDTEGTFLIRFELEQRIVQRAINWSTIDSGPAKDVIRLNVDQMVTALFKEVNP